MVFINDHDMRLSGDFPLNTNGGQLGMGQAGHAGCVTHVVEAFRQIGGRAEIGRSTAATWPSCPV